MATGNSILYLNESGRRATAREYPIDHLGDPAMCVGAAIAQARKKGGLSQAQLAKQLNRSQSYVAKIELGQRSVEVREFLWIILRTGADPIPLLTRMLHYGSFRDLQDRPKREDPHSIEDYDEQDEIPDDDESALGHLKFGPGGAV